MCLGAVCATNQCAHTEGAVRCERPVGPRRTGDPDRFTHCTAHRAELAFESAAWEVGPSMLIRCIFCI